jgi:LysR family hydrogen peroxide-inducible transcriptional activator
MEMHQVRYFLALCDELNFTRAAERCNVAQPSLTRAIKLLEEELGGPLFHRERANTHLSELGRIVRPHLEQVYAEARSAKQQALDFVKLRRSSLKLGLMCTIAPALVIDLVRVLRERHPALELELVDASGGELQRRLLAGELETAIYSLPGEPADERLHYLPLFREQFMIAVAAGHRLAQRNAIRVVDLAGESYINRSNCEIYDFASEAFELRGADCPTVYRSERDDWVLAMISAGLGFGFIPEHSVQHPGVVARPCVEPEFWREVALVTVRGRPHSPAVGALVREAMRTQWRGRPALAIGGATAGAGDVSAAT